MSFPTTSPTTEASPEVGLHDLKDDRASAMEAGKPCASCGRVIEWRKKWERCWDEVRYCSDACRKRRPGTTDRALEQCILDLLGARSPDKTICPSEAARCQFGEGGWRDEMERTRRAARRLVAKGDVEILQRGRPVNPSTAKGPIRIRLARQS